MRPAPPPPSLPPSFRGGRSARRAGAVAPPCRRRGRLSPPPAPFSPAAAATSTAAAAAAMICDPPEPLFLFLAQPKTNTDVLGGLNKCVVAAALAPRVRAPRMFRCTLSPTPSTYGAGGDHGAALRDRILAGRAPSAGDGVGGGRRRRRRAKPQAAGPVLLGLIVIGGRPPARRLCADADRIACGPGRPAARPAALRRCGSHRLRSGAAGMMLPAHPAAGSTRNRPRSPAGRGRTGACRAPGTRRLRAARHSEAGKPGRPAAAVCGRRRLAPCNGLVLQGPCRLLLCPRACRPRCPARGRPAADCNEHPPLLPANILIRGGGRA